MLTFLGKVSGGWSGRLSPVLGVGSLSRGVVWEVQLLGLLQFPRDPLADDNMECVDSERRPHFPQFSYSASGTA